jgi:hypothetical protein
VNFNHARDDVRDEILIGHLPLRMQLQKFAIANAIAFVFAFVSDSRWQNPIAFGIYERDHDLAVGSGNVQ